MPLISSVYCYSVFHANKQVKVYTVRNVQNGSIDAFNQAKIYADKSAANGYHCSIEEFSVFCRDVGILVYSTNKGEK